MKCSTMQEFHFYIIIYSILQNKLTMKQEAVLKVSYQILQVIIISKFSKLLN